MILIEGSDYTGKTTLAKTIQSETRRAYVHYGPLPDWWNTASEFVDRRVEHAVYDRYHWSTWAYKQVTEQPVDLKVSDCVAIDQEIERELNGWKYATVLLYASDSDFYDDAPPDKMFSRSQIIEVNKAFRSVTEHFTLAIDVCKERPNNIPELLRKIGL